MRRAWLIASLFCIFVSGPAWAESRFIVRTQDGLPTIQSICGVLGCSVKHGLDGSLGLVFLVTTSDLVDANTFLQTLRSQPGVTNAELDGILKVLQASSSTPPAGLWDRKPVNYFGAVAWSGYVNQPASQIVRLAETLSTFGVKGAGIVAVIDTGINPHHPVLKNVLVPGYDFIRDKEGMPSEPGDLNQSTAALVDGQGPVLVNQWTAAVLDQSTAALVDNPQYAAFGHGTMVAGVVHLVAPKAWIMPLKAFRADGTGYTSDVLRAIYRGVQNNAKIINMSFSFSTYSQELSQAISYANRSGVICAASVGNGGANTAVYPAAFSDRVMGVAATTNDDQRSTFSNFGPGLVSVAAPGEGVITTYPFGTYAAAWGTSFSTPFVSGAAALLVDTQADCNQSQAAQAIAHAQWVSAELGNGRLDLYQALLSWRQALGIQ